MRDLTSARAIYFKGALFLLLGPLASGLLLMLAADWRVCVLLAIAVWAFCRAYYFAFYVIEHYVDGSYRFAGLMDFAKYVLGRRRSPSERECRGGGEEDGLTAGRPS